MLLYASKVQKEIRRFKEHAENLRKKFERESDVEELLFDVESLQKRLRELGAVLPEEVSGAGSLGRHVAFMVHFLKKKEVRSCAHDIVEICERDIPALENVFFAWCGSEANIDIILSKATENLLVQRELDSAIRKSFVILKERLCQLSGAPDDLDGRDLVNAIFGGGAKYPLSGLSESEREAYRHLLDGLFGVFRNPIAHTSREPTWPETDAVISMVNYVLSRVNEWGLLGEDDS